MTEVTSLIADLLPKGEVVTIDEERGIAARVFVIGGRHLESFSGDLVRSLGAVAAMGIPLSEFERHGAMAFGAQLAPVVMSNLFRLLTETTELGVLTGDGEFVIDEGTSVRDLPHYMVPPVLTKWLEVNFAELGKWRPWLTALETAVQLATGEDEFSLAKLFSGLSSSPDTPPTTSSADSSPASRTEAGA